MTERELVAALESIGATDVRCLTKPTDAGAKKAVGVSLLLNGQKQRHAVALRKGLGVEDAYPALLGWIKAMTRDGNGG